MPPEARAAIRPYHDTILVVEDDPNDQMLIESAFRANGVMAPIHLVANGVEAIEYLMGEGPFADRQQFAYPSFIMTDLKMPKADGFDVLQHLKSNPQWAIIPTVVLSASNDPDDIKKAYMLGASSYHVKPQDYDGLRRQLKILHEYWMTCQVPEVDASGKRLTTQSKGRMGERFPQTEDDKQTRA